MPAKILKLKAIGSFLIVLSISAAFVASPGTNLGNLINAETDFSRMSVEGSRADAANKYFAENCLVLRRGEELNGKKAWNSQPQDTSKLSWYAARADMSSSGSMGYTTGPWQMKEGPHSKEAGAFGEYVTVWTKDAKGLWRVILDIGISYKKPDVAEKRAVDHLLKPATAGSLKTLAAAETALNSAAAGDKAAIYKTYVSSSIEVLRPNELPYLEQDAALARIATDSDISNYATKSVSNSGNLGYAYGTIDRQAADGKTVKRNYMHIWKLEKGQWKLVVDVVTG